MKKITAFLLLLVITASVSAQETTSQLFEKGRNSYYEKDYKKAIKYYTKIIEKNITVGSYINQLMDAYAARAQAYQKLEKFDLAEKDLIVVSKRGSKDSKGVFKLAQFYEGRGNQKEADLYYSKLYELDARSAFFHAQDFRIEAERITDRRSKEFSNEEITEVLELYRKAILIDPFSYKNYANKAAFQLQIDQPYAAIKTYQQFVELPPNTTDDNFDKAQALVAVGRIYFNNLKNEKSAAVYFKKAIGLWPMSTALISNFYEEIAYALKGEDLKNHLQKWQALNPNDGKMNFDFGKYYFTEKDYKNAIKHLDLAISYAGSTASGLGQKTQYYGTRALAYESLAIQEKNIEFFEKAIEDWDEALKSSFFRVTAEFYFYRPRTMFRLFKLKYEQDKKADLNLAAKITADVNKVLELDDKHAHAYETRANLNLILNGNKRNEAIEKDFSMHDKYCPSKK